MKKSEITALYKEAFPQTEHEADAGYILSDGTIIDISSIGFPYCHGREFECRPTLCEWKNNQKELPFSKRQTVDYIMNEIGGIEFTIDNCHLQCVRLPNKALTVKQKQSLTNIVSKILERGLIRVEVLGTSEYAEYNANSNTAEEVMSKIDNYYSTGKLNDII